MYPKVSVEVPTLLEASCSGASSWNKITDDVLTRESMREMIKYKVAEERSIGRFKARLAGGKEQFLLMLQLFFCESRLFHSGRFAFSILY